MFCATKDKCSGLVDGRCIYGHPPTVPCWGINLDVYVPICLREDFEFDEKKLCMTIRKIG